MKISLKQVHLALLALAFTFITWNIVNLLIVEVSFFKWIIIEIIFAVMLKIHKFTSSKLL